MQFPDPGPTTYRDTLNENSDDANPESHFDRFAVSKNVRLMYTYYPEHSDDANKTMGTINNAPPGEETPKGADIHQSPRISTKNSTCPPQAHQYAIVDQIDRMTYYNREMLACFPANKRKYMPRFRSRDLSDHLPVTFTHSNTKYKVATWNMRFFDPTIDPTADQSAFKRRKEIVFAKEFETILDKFDIVAVQELSPTKRPDRFDDSTSMPGVVQTNNIVINKMWYWSKTRELGFAVKSHISVSDCKEIDMTGTVSKQARPAFMCSFVRVLRHSA